jgi:hypothetical protein
MMMGSPTAERCLPALPEAGGRQAVAVGAPLVSSPISQQEFFEDYPYTEKLKRPFKGETPTPPTRTGSQLQGFSDKSRGRLRFTATNARDVLRSQFGLTYPGDSWPTDGREFKRHLNAFLTAARRAFPFLSYLWVAEFQSRGAPHVHLFFDLAATDETRLELARLWCRIVNPAYTEKDDHFKVHSNPKNFISWSLGTGSYLCKYLDKAAQKHIPQGFTSFGRWWGNSRGLVPDPDVTTRSQIEEEFPQVNPETGELYEQDAWKFLVRTVGRYHEKVNRRSWFRRTGRSTSALTGAPIFRQTLGYLRRIRGIPPIEQSPF